MPDIGQPLVPLTVKVSGWNQYNNVWTCRVYTNNYTLFSDWMEIHCPKSQYIFRYNSGNPAYIIDIFDESEAAIFKLSWCT